MRLFALLILLSSCISVFAQQPKAKLPSEDEQKAALVVIGDVYKPDYEKAKTPAQKIELAKKLLGEGIATKDDPVSRFVLFRVARDIASKQGDLSLAFDAISRIGAEYEVETLQLKVDAATVAVKALKTPKEHQACASILAPLIDEAVVADCYCEAKSFASLALGSAREARDSNRIKQFIAKIKELDEIAVEFEKVKVAKVALEAMPTDPAANYAVGRFLCLVKGDWKRGITMLALSDNEEFKAAALLELETQPDSLKVGDAWWKVAEGLEATATSRAQAHAGEWYRQALPSLSGLTKARVEKLLAEIPSASTESKAGPAKVSELLSGWDVKAGTQLGEWSAEKQGLVGGSPAVSKINLGNPILDDYDLDVGFSVLAGKGDVIITLPLVNDHLCFRTVEAKTAVFLFGVSDETTKKRLHAIEVRPGVVCRAKIQVRNKGQDVKVLLQDAVVLTMSDNPKATDSSSNVVLTLSPNFKVGFSNVSVTPMGDGK